MQNVLTIAGSDCSGGAGIQADIKTMCAHNKYAMSVICALTAQNTLGVSDILEIDAPFVYKQIKAVVTDIRPHATKIGMISNVENMSVIKKAISEFNLQNVVIDPVMVATSNDVLLNQNSVEYMRDEFLKCASIITPNICEGEILAQMSIKSIDDMKKAAKIIGQKGNCSVLIKGGHFKQSGLDLLYTNNDFFELILPYVENSNTHGTGCSLSSAIACNLAQGQSIYDAC